MLRVEHFFGRNNAIIFEAILDIANDGRKVDFLAVSEWLKTKGKLEEIGGIYALQKMALTHATAAHTEEYARIVIEKWKLRKLMDLAAEINLKVPQYDDATEVLPLIESKLFEIGREIDTDENQLSAGVAEVLEQIRVRENPLTEIGINTKLASWQKIFGGILPGRYYTIGGRPGAGKTALVEQFILACLNANKRVLFVSRELRRDRVVGRLAAKISGVNLSKFLRGHSSSDERERLKRAVNEVVRKNLFLVTPSRMTGAGLRSLMRRASRKEAVDLVVVDYMQLLDVDDGQDRFGGIAENSKQIRQAINETNIPALVCVQLNRQAESNRPRMSHIREAGQIEQDADAIALLWHEEENREGNDMYSVTMSIEKNRDGAKDLDERLLFYGPTMEFRDEKLMTVAA